MTEIKKNSTGPQPAFMDGAGSALRRFVESYAPLDTGGMAATVATSRYARNFLEGRKRCDQARMVVAPPACPVREIPEHLQKFGVGKKYPIAKYNKDFTLITPENIDQARELKRGEQLVLAIDPESRRPALYKALAGTVKNCSTQQDLRILKRAQIDVIANGVATVAWAFNMGVYGFLAFKQAGEQQRYRTGRRRSGGGRIL